ncbi:PLP-dependent aspartate aminotransferase family protein [Pelagibius sp. Alg239-R121]|uniref:trans-sulfuration enzyme family protein n=1 Tax=Pelagibius sp. Alg239-R121 TaxID=2993448 RepID=UPI0024A7882B|nr:PLP-dependent aspartate aminotransferase family protein [Pelagibius sp. Alg239-R121]
MTDSDTRRPATLAAQTLHSIDPATGGVVPVIQPSTTFVRDRDYQPLVDGRIYARDHAPNPEQAEALLTRLEGGTDALLFASGMAAAAAVVQALRPGDHIVAQNVMYWTLRSWMVSFCAEWGIGLDLVDTSQEGAFEEAVQTGKTKLVWIETPANPTWDVIDIAAVAEVAHAAGAQLVVDSTVVTPVLSRPLELGADIVFHSATKYLNGHSDVLAGALVTANEDPLWARIKDNRLNVGGVLGTFEAWLLLRGMRTLYLRVERCCENAMAIARHFDGHAAIEAVLYPGLESHPRHAVARKQMPGGFGGMLSLRIKGGREAALRCTANLNCFQRATSLGGVESLVEHRASVEGPDSPIPDDMLRLSVGVEDVEDLILDLETALA